MSDVASKAIAIVATFTVEPLASSLSFMLTEAGIVADVRIAPYNQVFQQLLTENSLLSTNNKGVNVVLIRIEDFIRDVEDEQTVWNTIERTKKDLCSALSHFAGSAKTTTIVSVLSPSPRAGNHKAALDNANRFLTERVALMSGLVLLPDAETDRFLTGAKFDSVSDHLAHIPFTHNYFASLGAAIARRAHAILVPAHKVLALDCDNTLWRGVVGEDGVDGIEISPAFAALQRFALRAHSQGVLICLVSKNNAQDVLDVFERRTDMLLSLDHVVAHRIDWQPKPQNLSSLAKQLNLGLDSFVFIDDNPVECGAMNAQLPQVITLQLPSEDKIDSFLANLWTFDKVAITEEDLRRTELYKEEVARNLFESQSTDISNFIASLAVEVDIDAPQENEWPRLAQLTQRTNQFNSTTKRRTEAELRSLVTGNLGEVRRVRVKDRFGDYGLVGLAIIFFQKDRLFVDTFLLSCRVLGRGVEHAIIRRLGSIAISRQLGLVEIDYVETSKNEPARAFFENVASPFKKLESDTQSYLIPTDVASSIAHRPGFDPDAVIAASKQTANKPLANFDTVSRSSRYVRLASVLTSDSAINELIVVGSTRVRDLSTAATVPTNDTERRLVELWEKLLHIKGIGIDDDYFDLGGSSLLTVSLFASIFQQFGRSLPLTTILSSSTVRELAKQIISDDRAEIDCLIDLKTASLEHDSARFLFLVHDGDGETLLYSNLAQRLPDNIGVVGINPRPLPGIPLAHSSIEGMASFYISQIKSKQSQGPYLLGGMCAGGVIAYEIANQLLQAGDFVDLVLILDAATPQTSRIRFLSTAGRMDRFTSSMKLPATEQKRHARNAAVLIIKATRKFWNLLKWEVTDKIRKISVNLRFRMLKALLSRGKPWPQTIPSLTVREIYEQAEAAYIPASVSGTRVVLIRASNGVGGDTPYVSVYANSSLGWNTLANNLTSIDVNGGHYSMLQTPNVDDLARKLQVFLLCDIQQAA